MRKVLIFCLGAAVGAVGTYILMRKKHEELLREEVESVKDAYRAKADIPEEPKEGSADIQKPRFSDKPDDLMEYYKTIEKNRYDTAEKSADIPEAAYIIPPDSFGELDYDQISLNYWADKVLTDEDDNIIEAPETIIGGEALGSFGKYEDDSVYVRNDELRVDYEILLDTRTFAEYRRKISG